MSRESIQYFGIPIEYELTRKPVKNLNIRINESGVISVSAGLRVPLKEINDFVQSRAEWIIRSLAELERYNSLKPDGEIYSGKKLYFLGNQYTAEVIESKEESVEISGAEIIIKSRSADDSEHIKRIYKKWLLKQAEIIFAETTEKMHSVVKEENIPMPQVHIRNMKTRWGSCKPSDTLITLNLQLIKTDIQCIEQVVLHELIHFIEQNHGERFYKQLEKYMPDWKERKQRLEEKYKDGIF